MEEVIYLNGAMVPRSEARISALDYGFLYGHGLFETMRSYSGHIFRLRQHLNRLVSSGRGLGLDVESLDCDLEKALYDTLRANMLADARLRLTVSGGGGDASLDLTGSSGLTVLIVVRHHNVDSFSEGLTAAVSKIRRNSRSPLVRIKSLNYLDSLLARKEARASGAGEALFLNEEGFVAEGATSNLFLVSRGALVTPDEESGILPGITRQVVIELASRVGLKIDERSVTLEELLCADEAFVTNSIIEISPLLAVDGQRIGLGGAGKVTRQLMQAYADLLRAEVDSKG